LGGWKISGDMVSEDFESSMSRGETILNRGRATWRRRKKGDLL